MTSQSGLFVVVRSRVSLVGNSENEASCSDAWNSLFEASLLARRVDKKWQNIRMKFGKQLLRCVRGFTSFLRFAFWGFPRCYAGFILADLSAWTCCFFNVSSLLLQKTYIIGMPLVAHGVGYPSILMGLYIRISSFCVARYQLRVTHTTTVTITTTTTTTTRIIIS